MGEVGENDKKGWYGLLKLLCSQMPRGKSSAGPLAVISSIVGKLQHYLHAQPVGKGRPSEVFDFLIYSKERTQPSKLAALAQDTERRGLGLRWFGRVAETRPVWFKQINKTNQTNRLNKKLGLAACGSTASASSIGWAVAETGEADGDGSPFFRRAADGNRAAMFFDDFLDRGET